MGRIAGEGDIVIGAIIPCKKGSKGVPDKNFRDMLGQPMWHWTLEAAIDADIFDTIIASSNGGFGVHGIYNGITYNDHENIPNIDVSSLDDLCKIYAIQYPEISVWCLLQPTSVLRNHNDIRNAYYCLCLNHYDSVVSVESVGDKYWIKIDGKHKAMYDPMNRLMRQNPLTNVLFYENGAIYFFKREVILNGSRIGGDVGLYEMPQERSHQIDSPFDWKLCEAILRERG